jgi:hypothetical protein
MTSRSDTVAPHPHAWIHDEQDEAVCYLCGALPNTPEGDALCDEPWPAVPAPEVGEKIGLSSGLIVEADRDPNEYILTLWRLILAEDPGQVAQLETLIGKAQNEAVDHFIERSYWGEDVPAFVGGKGTPTERRAALLTAYRAHQAEE